MRSWIIAVCTILSLGAMTIPLAEATATTRDAPVMVAQASPAPQGAPPSASHHPPRRHYYRRRYHTVCHNVRVWKRTPHGRILVRERRCHKVWR